MMTDVEKELMGYLEGMQTNREAIEVLQKTVKRIVETQQLIVAHLELVHAAAVRPAK